MSDFGCVSFLVPARKKLGGNLTVRFHLPPRTSVSFGFQKQKQRKQKYYNSQVSPFAVWEGICLSISSDHGGAFSCHREALSEMFPRRFPGQAHANKPNVPWWKKMDLSFWRTHPKTPKKYKIWNFGRKSFKCTSAEHRMIARPHIALKSSGSSPAGPIWPMAMARPLDSMGPLLSLAGPKPDRKIGPLWALRNELFGSEH